MASLGQLGNDLFTGRRSVDVVGHRRLWYAVSAVLMVLAVAGVLVRGINLGIEFQGGSEVRVSGAPNLEDYEQRVRDSFDDSGTDVTALTVTQLGTDTLRIQTEQIGDGTETATEEVRSTLAQEFGVQEADVTSSFIGPSWGQTVTTKAIQSLIAFTLLVALVLAIYFRTWKMSFAAIVALVHDVVFTVGIYALAGFEVSPASVIGFLTILGYSIYDTIVVFDKVRENTDAAFDHGRMTYDQAVNRAVNQTIVRSINTSVVALIPIAVILVVGFVWIGPGTLLDLSLALFIGVAVGAYSSVFIAPALLAQLRAGDDDVVALDKRATKFQSKHPEVVRAGGPVGSDLELAGIVGGAAEPTPGGVGDPHTTAGASTGGATAMGAATATRPVGTTEEDAAESPGAARTPGTLGGRQVHAYAKRGPRNQPKRPPRSSR